MRVVLIIEPTDTEVQVVTLLAVQGATGVELWGHSEGGPARVEDLDGYEDLDDVIRRNSRTMVSAVDMDIENVQRALGLLGAKSTALDI